MINSSVTVFASTSASLALFAIPFVVSSASGTALPTSEVPFILVYLSHFQFPPHKLIIVAVSPTAVVMLAPAFGKIRDVAWCVSVNIH